MVKFAILGPIELRHGGRKAAVGGPRQIALLALMLLNANRGVSSECLTDTLWGGRSSAGADKRLQMAIARLRRALDLGGVRSDAALRTVGGGYLLAVEPGELDADVFETHVDEGTRALEAGEPADAAALLREALAMWRGPVLADVAYEEFAQAEIRRLEEMRLAAVEARVEADLRLGEHAQLVAELEALTASHPMRERMTAQLMLAYYRCGRQADALELYHRTQVRLDLELGLQPGPSLRALQRQILEHAPALELVAPPPPRRRRAWYLPRRA